ncbi:hypothetical protein GCM10029976_055010 [Kribbella albertanoniae]|uniref:Uncharacterized protein n=1 Tax=Kribbella albertanoniae TaxID=1266829 RepID=A0A4R4Q675_9ACTN|nr:hypothetical protein [Kribbella albertanoniae]TDC30676.1 hypothetical protein E1261_12765 [Kribbella albertanoniae]
MTAEYGTVAEFEGQRLAGERLVVVVDFVQFAAGESIGDAVAGAVPGRRVVRIDPVADLARSGEVLTLSGLADRYAEQLAGTVVGGSLDVIGYCSAAPLTIALVQGLLDRGVRVERQLLVSPSIPDRVQVRTELAEMLNEFGSPDLMPAALPDSVPAADVEIRRVLATGLAAMAEAHGLSEVEAEILTGEYGDRCAAWLSYLIAASAAEPAEPAAGTRLVLSADLAGPVVAGWAERRATITILVPQRELTASPEFLTVLQQLVQAES